MSEKARQPVPAALPFIVCVNFDAIAKSPQKARVVIPVQAGIQ
jgi:hypothetical protein